MVHSEKWGGFWAFLDYEDVYDAEQVADIFSSGAGKEVPGVPGSIPFIPIDYDPPLVQDYRKLALSLAATLPVMRSIGLPAPSPSDRLEVFVTCSVPVTYSG